jgi:lipopolysaccharide transport system permease protein
MNEYSLTIEAGKTRTQYFRDLWIYRELFLFLAWRDILVRYKQTVIGIAWSVIRPLLTMIVFTVVFGKIAKMPSEGVPYAVLVYAALLPWQFFSNTVLEGGNSLIGNANIISKVYFPRIIIPSTCMVVSLVDFLISTFILAFLMIWYQFMPGWRVVFLPIFLGFGAIAALGITYWLSALNVKYRDFRHVIPFIIQFGLYVSPVGFSSSVIPEKWRLLYALNPMVGVIDGFRWALLGGSNAIDSNVLTISFLVAVLLFLSGFHFFRRTESEFADVI